MKGAEGGGSFGPHCIRIICVQGLHGDIVDPAIFHPVPHWFEDRPWKPMPKKGPWTLQGYTMPSPDEVFEKSVGVSQSWVTTSSKLCTARLDLEVSDGSFLHGIAARLGFDIKGVTLDQFTVKRKRIVWQGLRAKRPQAALHLGSGAISRRALAIIVGRNWLVGFDWVIAAVAKTCVSTACWHKTALLKDCRQALRAQCSLLRNFVEPWALSAAYGNALYYLESTDHKTFPSRAKMAQDMPCILYLAFDTTNYTGQASAKKKIRKDSGMTEENFDARAMEIMAIAMNPVFKKR